MKVYRHIHTDEIIEKGKDAEDYAMEQLGLMKDGKSVIIPKGEHGAYTQEQFEFICEFTEWYFSGNWIEEDLEDEDIPDLERSLEMADRAYQENLDRSWGL